MRAKALCILIGFAIGPSSCSTGGGDETGLKRGALKSNPPAAGDLLIQDRAQKDRSFRLDSDSPIPPQEREDFRGLSYFPLNPALRFRAELHRYQRPERVRLGTNTGEMRDALRYGYFEFEVAGRKCRLEAYRTEEGQASGRPYLFIPFRDTTSGKESYGGGRYIDLVENTTGIYDLDFNRAYNPLCAYGGEYSCPVPPEENRLAVPIEAGEKAYAPDAAIAMPQ